MLPKPFVINHHGQLVFPENFFPQYDFSLFETLDQFTNVVRRDFGDKAPKEADITSRLEMHSYTERYELCRDLVLHLFWANRYALAMYQKRPMRWGDLPRHRDDIFVPVFRVWNKGAFANQIEAAFRLLPPKWDQDTEDHAFHLLFNVLQNQQSEGAYVHPILPGVSEAVGRPHLLTYLLKPYERDYPGYGYDEVINYGHHVPELESLMRHAMVLHNQYRWDPASAHSVEVGQLRDDDYIIAFYPRNDDVLHFIRRAKMSAHEARRNRENGHRRPSVARSMPQRTLALSQPVRPYTPVDVRKRFSIMPRLEAIATYAGEIACTNADLIRNHAYCWSRMTEAEIAEKTGIEQRCYSELSLADMALLVARAAVDRSGRKPAEIGAVLFCSCTSSKLIPSLACWLSGELGLQQTHTSCDIIAACAGMPYGASEAVRILQEIDRPVLLVCAEKFSDKIGTVRTSRMLFGDGAAALIIGPAATGTLPDIEVVQTYASGPWSEVNSIVWPNPEFDNNITVLGPEVRSLAGRYLKQMINEVAELPHPEEGSGGTLLDAIDLIVPHQANKKMVETLAAKAGVEAGRLYFNIENVGNTSAASIPMAICDAVRAKRIDRPMRVFAPGFGAGAVAGYVVMRVDPAVVCSIEEKPDSHAEENGFAPLKGKVALVTGASRGIGRAIALELARRGATVAVNYRSAADAAESLTRELQQLGADCLRVQGDVAKQQDAERIVQTVVDRWQRLDILVNNAGITRDRTLRRMTEEDWEEVISVNMSGTFHTTSAALPAMVNQRFGRIINIASVVAQTGAVGQANYSASKGGIIAFTKTLAREVAKYNITANVVCPGYTSTDMVTAIPETIAAKLKSEIPLGRFATPEEIAKTAAFLATDAHYITGQELNVNGGYYM